MNSNATTSQEQELISSSLRGGSYGSNDDNGISHVYQKKIDYMKYLPLVNFVLLVFVIIGGSVYISTNNGESLSSTTAAIGHLSRNLILQQFSQEQRIRSQGDSGITNTRGLFDGDDVFDDNTYASGNGAAGAVHDHADYFNTFGMGELQVVMNGVEFQTRHNDYLLYMPSTTSSEYGASEEISLPDIPLEILNKNTVEEQVIEMQEWFRAFKTQNISHRNYTAYFKPILCYLEGTWVMDDDILEEPFDSDRHEIDAATWRELHDKIRYLANSGRKDPRENLAHLPSSIRNLKDGKYPIISNWEYRILCHPLEHDIPTDRFRIANDISVQLMGSPLTRDELYYSRRARFELAKYVNLSDPAGNIYGQEESYPHGYWSPGVKTWNYLDYLMEQIPGKDNYLANLTDKLAAIFSKSGIVETALHHNDKSLLNSGYYSRYFAIPGIDAMGRTKHRRGFNDRYLFTAQTTQQKVSPIAFKLNNEEISSRWSYAIPLEIIYLTPLTQWNPHNIQNIPPQDFGFPWPDGGRCSNNDPFEGWSWYFSYFTPAQFYDFDPDSGDLADSAMNGICALDENGISQPVMASGHYITFPKIGGDVGYVRQRFPIFPIHGAATPAFNEVKSLQAIVLDDDYDDMNSTNVAFFGHNRDRIYGFSLLIQGGGHEHIINILGWQVNIFWYNEIDSIYYNGSDYKIIVESSIAVEHEHTIIAWRWRQNENTQWNYVIEQCKFGAFSDEGNWMNNTCADGHNKLLRGYA